MKIKELMSKEIDKYYKTDPHDSVSIEERWTKMFQILTEDYDETVAYLSKATSRELIVCGEVWDDIVDYFGTEDLFEVFQECINAHPEIADDLKIDLENAREVFKR